jgi:hypothetical protein
MNIDVIRVPEFSVTDYAHALLGMPSGNISFEEGIEDQLLRLAVHQVFSNDKIGSQEDQVFSLQALLCWVMYAGMQMQKNHSIGQGQVC